MAEKTRKCFFQKSMTEKKRATHENPLIQSKVWHKCNWIYRRSLQWAQIHLRRKNMHRLICLSTNIIPVQRSPAQRRARWVLGSVICVVHFHNWMFEFQFVQLNYVIGCQVCHNAITFASTCLANYLACVDVLTNNGLKCFSNFFLSAVLWDFIWFNRFFPVICVGFFCWRSISRMN